MAVATTIWDRVKGACSWKWPYQSRPNNPPRRRTPPPKYLDLKKTRIQKIIDIYDSIKGGEVEDLRVMLLALPQGYVKPFESTYNELTILQTACKNPKKIVAKEMVVQILQCLGKVFKKTGDGQIRTVVKEDEKRINQFINYRSISKDAKIDGKTALHFAALRFNKDVVLALIRSEADVALECREKIQPIQLIFSRIPDAIKIIYDLKIVKMDPDGDSGSEDFQVKVDYTPICGIPSPNDDKSVSLVDTSMLYESLQHHPRERKFEILKLPLVQLFLEDKWKLMRTSIGFLAAYHIIWCLSYVTFTYHLYFSTCPNRGENTTCSTSPDSYVGLYPLNPVGYFVLALYFLVSIGVGVKVVLEIYVLLKDSKNYCFHFWHRLENSFVLGLLLLTGVGVWRLCRIQTQSSESISGDAVYSWEHPFAAAGMIIAFLVILWQVKKFSVCNIPVRIELFMKVLKLIVIFVAVHSCLLVGFALACRILMPEKGEFDILDGGFFKVFTMMATGEMNYDDLFYSDTTTVEVPSRLSTKALLGTFQTLMNITLLGIANGIAFSNCQKLLNDAEMVNLSCQLEEIHLLEKTFLLKYFPGWLKETNILVADQQSLATKQFNKIPKHLRGPILEILNG